MGRRKQQRKRNVMEKPPQHKTRASGEIEKKPIFDKDFSGEKDRLSELPYDILIKILSLLSYSDAVQTASVSRRWKHLVAQLPNITFYLSFYGFSTSSAATPSELRVQSMARTLQRRCSDMGNHPVKTLHLFYRKDVAMECRYADEFIALANAAKLILRLQCARESLPDEDAGAWSLQLPPATTELKLRPYWYAVRLPHIHGSAVNTLRSMTLMGEMVLRQQEFLVANVLPSLEDLCISECTLAVDINITSRAMPRLKNLNIVDVSVMTDETKAAINILVDDLRTLRMSGYLSSSTKPTSEREMFRPFSRYNARFTTYSSFCLRAPKLQVFEWRCCYADEVHVESVGCLSNVVVEVAAGRMPTPFGKESKYVTVQQRDKVMTDILKGLMSGLQPCGWENVKRKCKERDDRWLCFEITSAPLT